MPGLKEGILLEVGFDDVTPNLAQDISSWAYDFAMVKVDIIDNRAIAVPCYDPAYTLIEKLQTISTKYRKEQASGELPKNFMRHYYDVYCLLKDSRVQAFTGSEDYMAHKKRRFRGGDNPVISENEAFFLHDPKTRAAYEKAYVDTKSLYYGGQPGFAQILIEIGAWAPRL